MLFVYHYCCYFVICVISQAKSSSSVHHFFVFWMKFLNFTYFTLKIMNFYTRFDDNMFESLFCVHKERSLIQESPKLRIFRIYFEMSYFMEPYKMSTKREYGALFHVKNLFLQISLNLFTSFDMKLNKIIWDQFLSFQWSTSEFIVKLITLSQV